MHESGWTGNLTKPHQKADAHYKSYLVEQWQQLNAGKHYKVNFCRKEKLELQPEGFFVNYIENFRFVYKCLLRDSRL